MPPIDTTTGTPAARAAASSARITSDAVTLPPGLLTHWDNRFHFSGQGERRGFVPQWYITANIALSFLAIHNCAIGRRHDTDAVTLVSAGVFNA
ncbi:hypothetical protein MJ389_11140 [Escherichia coli]|nr:hypothetical protein MJ389_11140 [Escherichia coli]